MWARRTKQGVENEKIHSVLSRQEGSPMRFYARIREEATLRAEIGVRARALDNSRVCTPENCPAQKIFAKKLNKDPVDIIIRYNSVGTSNPLKPELIVFFLAGCPVVFNRSRCVIIIMILYRLARTRLAAYPGMMNKKILRRSKGSKPRTTYVDKAEPNRSIGIEY
ncbi:hypothetical protein KQX54_005662 [Cotesia glomerata]|uniref:Uncharacterized protein n=1 Tax=Cotesia glomerata TaxID=32391 RepID=A0AAV7I5C6_COTGL|nr:hypothetical protein KQX54_005662 [Cotesia glomerata]